MTPPTTPDDHPTQKKDQPQVTMSLRARQGVAISWYCAANLFIVPGDCRVASLLAMTVVVEGCPFCFTLLLSKLPVGWCSAQRIKKRMIAGGNHTLNSYDPALQGNLPKRKEQLP